MLLFLSLQRRSKMLILSRKLGESIVIGGITVTITDLSAGKVSIGIDAPQEMKIRRSELAIKERTPCKL
jgi:carbon storage regulator